jgi:hypothetical protein
VGRVLLLTTFGDQRLPSQDADAGTISDPPCEDMVDDQIAAAASEPPSVASPPLQIESREDDAQEADAQMSGVSPEVSVSLNIVRISLIRMRISYKLSSPHGVGCL